jgi:hypothetical protein
MFFIRASILKKIVHYEFVGPKTVKTGEVGTIYHVLERLFTILTDEEGYEVYRVPMF